MASETPKKPGGKRPSGESSFRKSSGPGKRPARSAGDTDSPRKSSAAGKSARPGKPGGGGPGYGTGSRPNRASTGSGRPSGRGPRPGADFNEYSEDSYRQLERGETGSERPTRSSRPAPRDGAGRFSKPGGAPRGERGSDDRKPARGKKTATDFSAAPRRPTGYKSRTEKPEERSKSFGRSDKSDDRPKSFGRSDRADDRPKTYGRKPVSDAGDERPKRSRPSDRDETTSRSGFRGRSDRSFDRSADREPGHYKGASDRDRPERASRDDRDERPAPMRKSYDKDEADENRPVKPYNREGRETAPERDRPAGRSAERPDRKKASYGISSERPLRAAKPKAEGDEEPRFAKKAPGRFEKTPGKGKFEKGKKKEERDEPPTYNLRKFESKTNPGNEQIRLNRYIANSGVCSRREADELIAAGEIKVNGQVITEMGHLVSPSDSVQYGKKILNREKLVYVLLNKPKGFITTTEDPEERKTVMELVANASKERIFPVGRLDRNTSGLLLFTNDGELAQKLSHPSYMTSKVYQLELDKPITEEHIEEIKAGLELEDGKADIDDIAILAPDRMALGIELHIGRNRIVRRIFEHLGYEVVKLDRVAYAGLTKKDLARGQWRFLDEKEVIRLKYFD